MIKGVITGDLVNSTNIAAEWRQAVVGALYKCAADFSPLTPINIETTAFRLLSAILNMRLQ